MDVSSNSTQLMVFTRPLLCLNYALHLLHAINIFSTHVIASDSIIRLLWFKSCDITMLLTGCEPDEEVFVEADLVR